MMDLRPLLVIIRRSGGSVKQLSRSLDVSNEYASRIATELEKEGVVNKVRSGKQVLLFPDMDSILNKQLLLLETKAQEVPEIKLEALLHPASNLKLIWALRSGPKTLGQALAVLGCSRPTFYRMLEPYAPGRSGLVMVFGRKEKTYELDTTNPLCTPLADLAEMLFGEEPPPSEPLVLRKVRLTSLRARTLLFVSSHMSYRDRPVSSPALTQEGIAQGLWTTQQIISKELKRLVELGLLMDIRKHIKDKKRRYKTYELTEKGVKEREDITGSLKQTRIRITGFDGKRTRENIEDIPGMFKSKVSVVEVLNYLSGGEEFDCTEFRRTIESRRVSEFISNFQRLAELRYFFGRGKETERFRDWLETERSGVLAVKGVAGIGKTTFLAKIIQEHRRHWNLFFYTVNEWSKLENILGPLASFLGKMKKDQLRTLLGKGGETNIEEVMLVILNSLKDARALLIFDDVQKADEQIVLFLMALARSQLPSGVKVVLSGREIPAIYDRRDVFIKGTVQEIELSGLDQPTSEQLLAKRGIDESDFDQLYKLTEGHPLALELIDKMDGFSNKNLNLFIKEEIVPKLSSAEINILRFASIFRIPFPSEAFSIIQDVIRTGSGEEGSTQITEMAEKLEDNSFLISSGDSYRIGDVFRDFFYNSMDRRTRDELHLVVARYYNRQGTDDAKLEVVYHLASGGRENDAVDYLVNNGEELAARGLSHELGEILARIPLKRLKKRYVMHHHYFSALHLYRSGSWKRALMKLKRSAELARAIGQESYIARSLSLTGWVRANRGEWKKGRRDFEEALELARRFGSKRVESGACRDLGIIHFRKKDTKGLKKYFQRSKDILKLTKDRECRADQLLLASLVRRMQGRFDKGIELLERAAGICDATGNRSKRMTVMNELGELLLEAGDTDRALELFEQQENTAKATGEVYPRAKALINSARCLIEKDRGNEAEPKLYEAMHYFKQLGVPEDMEFAESCFRMIGPEIED